MMSDISGLHPLMLTAMRTGRMPSDAEIANATGLATEEVARMLRETAVPDEAACEPRDLTDPDEQRFRDKYRTLVDAMITDWYEDNPSAVALPADERERSDDQHRGDGPHPSSQGLSVHESSLLDRRLPASMNR